MSAPPRSPVNDPGNLLAKLLQGTSADSKVKLFSELVRSVAEVLGAQYAFIGELQSDVAGTVKTQAAIVGHELIPNFAYELKGTPCAQAISSRICHYPNELRKQFPDNAKLSELKAESYLGMPLRDREGIMIGLLVALDTKPMNLDPMLLTAFEIFASRAASELEHIRADRLRLETEAAMRQSHKMEAMGTLAGGIAHDFNNILGAVLGNAELAAEDLSSNHPAALSVTEVLRAARRGKHLVQQILTFSRRDDPDREVIALSEVVMDALGMLRAILPSELKLQRQIQDDIPCVVADAGQLQQVIVNLCTNAWHAIEDARRKATGKVGVCLDSVDLDEDEASRLDLFPGVHARLRISDNGQGMDQETLRKVFDPFFTTKEPGRGTGLGLAVVHGIISDHRGQVQIDSTPDEGTTITLLLPTTTAKPREDTVRQQIVPFGNNRHILYVDDDRSMVLASSRGLARLGFKVSFHDSPEGALDQFEKQPDDIDLVLSDYAMPSMNGVELLTRMREVRSDLPAILVSGNITDNIHIEAASSGISELIFKPHTQAALAASINRVLGNTQGLKLS